MKQFYVYSTGYNGMKTFSPIVALSGLAAVEKVRQSLLEKTAANDLDFVGSEQWGYYGLVAKAAA